jgi:hypothetical protein
MENKQQNMLPVEIGIPSAVAHNVFLTQTEKILFGYLRNLSQTSDGCFGSNKYLSKILHLTEQSISNAIQSLQKYLYINVKITPTQNGRSRIIYINREYEILYQPLIEIYWDFFLKKNQFENMSTEEWENFNLEELLSRTINKIIADYKKNYSADYKKNYSVYKDSNYKDNLIFKEDKSSLAPPELSVPNIPTKPIKPLSEEFQLLQNKEILYKECEEIFDYWCQFGKPLHKPQKNLINPTKTLQEAFIIISKELKRLNKQEIMNAIYYYYEMLTTPDKYNLHCEDPLHLVGINDFFKFNSFLKKKQLSAKENNPAKNIKSWYWECAQGEEYLIKKYGRKPSPNQKQIQSIEDKYPNITQQFKWAWRNAMEIDKRFVLTTPEKDENAFRKASIFLKDFIKKWYDQLPETLPAHDYNEVYLSKPHTLAHNFIPAILFATEGMDDSIKITTSWLHTPKMEERLVRYYRDQGCMSDPNDDRDEEYDMEAYNL